MIPLLLPPLAQLAATVTTVIVTTIAARVASDAYDAATNRSGPPSDTSEAS